MARKPTVSRTYQNGLLDSTHWEHYKPRQDDIVISTSIKAGTTWMQRICAALVFQTSELEQPVDASSPWLDMRNSLPDLVQPMLEAQTHRRFIKSHLPLDAIPYFDQVKYIVVGRDARDVFMSLVPHHYNVAPGTMQLLNTRNPEERLALMKELGRQPGPQETAAILKLAEWEGEDIPTLQDMDIRDIWKLWITRSLFSWEQDGYPYWSHFYHLNSWWQFKHLDNILFIHYADMLKDLDGQMRRVSEWLDIPVNEDIWSSLVDSATFETMKRQHEDTAPAVTHKIWKDPKDFFHKGTNGRWRDVLNEEDLKLYEDRKAKSLAPDAAAWLENGSLVSGYPESS
jgi:aryl sulfotransferase